MTKRERKHLKIIDAIAQVYIFLKTKAHKQARGTEEDTFRIFRSNPATCYLFFEPSASSFRGVGAGVVRSTPGRGCCQSWSWS